jgi:hypothetical protein
VSEAKKYSVMGSTVHIGDMDISNWVRGVRITGGVDDPALTVELTLYADDFIKINGQSVKDMWFGKEPES